MKTKSEIEKQIAKLKEENKKLKTILEEIKFRIELYNDCYEGTPDECISEIKNIII